MNTINLDSVGHFFENKDRRIELFNNVSLTLESNKSYAIVGPSGAGKSSLLSLAAGLESPKTGEISVSADGKQLNSVALRRHSGFIFQQFHLLPELDALNNIALPLKLKGDKHAISKAKESLSRIGLTDRGDHYPSELSGGEQQRVAIARAFTQNPKFIFADEPTGNLDVNTSRKVAQQLFDFSSSKQACLLVVTHSEELADNADHIFQLSNGQLEQVR